LIEQDGPLVQARTNRFSNAPAKLASSTAP
jgi:hypothetical protein